MALIHFLLLMLVVGVVESTDIPCNATGADPACTGDDYTGQCVEAKCDYAGIQCGSNGTGCEGDELKGTCDNTKNVCNCKTGYVIKQKKACLKKCTAATKAKDCEGNDYTGECKGTVCEWAGVECTTAEDCVGKKNTVNKCENGRCGCKEGFVVAGKKDECSKAGGETEATTTGPAASAVTPCISFLALIMSLLASWLM